MQYQGDGRYDVDLPTYFEAKLFSTTLGKIAFCILQPVCYYVRPLFMLPMVPTLLEIVNVIQILAVNYAVAHYWGENKAMVVERIQLIDTHIMMCRKVNVLSAELDVDIVRACNR